MIVANSTTGYNSSRYQPFVMNVPGDECVSVTFINTDPAQPHGLAITYYSDGVVAQPHETVSFKFQATRTGTFSVYEQILSTIAAWTSNAGSLNVHLGVTFR